jgi:hypothetical protein
LTAIRKRIGTRVDEMAGRAPNAVDMGSTAVLVTSESADNPVENVFDGTRGPGATRWVADADGEQSITLEFEQPRSISRVFLEIEEREQSRTQEVVLSVLRNGGRGFEELLRQEYTFDPNGATFQRESWRVDATDITHFRIGILPDKGRLHGRASVTSLVLALASTRRSSDDDHTQRTASALARSISAPSASMAVAFCTDEPSVARRYSTNALSSFWIALLSDVVAARSFGLPEYFPAADRLATARRCTSCEALRCSGSGTPSPSPSHRAIRIVASSESTNCSRTPRKKSTR